jgi:NAD(P)-dependent dehydrogenase (short-subunit alcohol dehydrogenase family)
MTTTPPADAAFKREPELPGQTVVVIGGSAGIGLETARRARAEGADVILTGRNPDRLEHAVLELGAPELGAVSSAAFDATDPAALDRFFAGLTGPIDHVMVTGPGPYYAPLADLDRDRAHRDFNAHEWLAIAVAQHAVGRVRPGGTLLFMSGTAGRTRGVGQALISASAAALPALIASLAFEAAPIRVNLIAAGFVDTPLSASLLGDDLDKRRAQLRAALPIRRVVEPADIAALAVHIMINTALTGATYDIDGGEALIASLGG